MSSSPAINWTVIASCANPDFDPAWWHAEGINQAIAKSICRTCPVRDVCLTEATRRGEAYGVWGGIDMRTEPRRRVCKNGHPRATSMEVLGGTRRCGPCYRNAQAKIAAKRKQANAARLKNQKREECFAG